MAPDDRFRCPDTGRWARVLFYPAAFLLRRRSLSTKLTLLWGLTVVAMVVAIYSLSRSVEREVEPSERQLAGLPYIPPITRAVQALQLHRGLSATLLAGDAKVAAWREAQASEVDAAIAALVAERPSGPAAEERARALADGWRSLRESGLAMQPEANFDAHTLLVERAGHYALFVADEFLLTQDPDLPSFYLLDTALNKLPNALERLGRLRAYGATLLVRGTVGDAQRLQLRVMLAELDGAVRDVELSLAKASVHNRDLASTLDDLRAELVDAARRVADVVTREVLRGRLDTPPETYLGLATNAIDRGYRLVRESLLPTAATLIDARVNAARSRLWASAVIALLAFAVAVYLSASIYFVTICRLRRLARSARALAAGDLAARVDVDTSDELGSLGESFNHMAAGVASMIEARRDDRERLNATIETAMDAVVQITAEGTIIGWNGQAERMFGWLRGEALGRALAETIIPTQLRDAHREGLARCVATGSSKLSNTRVELQGLHRDGHEFPIELSVTVLEHAGRVEFSGFIRDISKRKEAERLIWTQANFDPLTRLPNRHMFHDRLVQEVQRAARQGHRTALLFIDLDRFKEVNDSLGHASGDELLRQTARRVRACVRTSDTVARLGGDEFTVLLPALDEVRYVERVCAAILGALSEPFDLDGEVVHVSASIGVTVAPDDTSEPSELLKHADQAMYAAKNSGRGHFRFFTSTMQTAAQERRRLVHELRAALRRDQLEVHYQPIVALSTGRIAKAEALLRWRHPERGLVPPDAFIPLAEETGLIVEIGKFVCTTAARQLSEWVRRWDPAFRIAINVSPVQLGRSAGAAYREWLAELDALGLPPRAFEIEITESVFLDQEGDVASKLSEIRRAGVVVALDDFGTGYSSLSYLQRFEVDVLKIDRSFIAEIDANPSSLALTEAIVAMAHRLGLAVVAEGVETPAQRRILESAGCDFAQGWLFGRPVPADAFGQLLALERGGVHAARVGE